METRNSTPKIPFLRSCMQESESPIDGEVQGDIPRWLKGNLIRIGPGRLEVGSDRYSHLFDGLGLMHKFSFQEGKVQYQSRFVRSDTYRKNMEANRIARTEFGTTGVPDPCKTIFQRFSSHFTKREFSDNVLVTVVLYSDEAYACSESNYIWKIDPDTLESLEKVNIAHHVPVNVAIAHAHEDRDGTVYNVGSNYGYNCSYSIIKFPPKASPTDPTFAKASEICRIPAAHKMNMSYHHSFGMTDNYFVFVEQPLCLYLPRLLLAKYVGGTFASSLRWDNEEQCKIHVVKRSDGQLLQTKYVSGSFFVFHHINAYEEDDHLIVDMCTYDEGDVINSLYIKALEESVRTTNKMNLPFESRPKRLVLPLNIEAGKRLDENLVTLKNTKATAYRQADGAICLNLEVLTGSEPWCAELPRINYEQYNGRKYKYFYAVARNETQDRTQLIKVDVDTRETTPWSEEGAIPSEPVFIPNPELQIDAEDSGVVLASLLYLDDETKVSLVVLDARSMTEIGRTTFQTKSSVPGDFHGTFIQRE